MARQWKRMTQGFSHTDQAIAGANLGQDMGRIGPLVAAGGCRHPRSLNSVSIVVKSCSSAWPSTKRVRNSLSTEASKPGSVSSSRHPHTSNRCARAAHRRLADRKVRGPTA